MKENSVSQTSIFATHQIPCGSGLAREEAGTLNIDGD